MEMDTIQNIAHLFEGGVMTFINEHSENWN